METAIVWAVVAVTAIFAGTASFLFYFSLKTIGMVVATVSGTQQAIASTPAPLGNEMLDEPYPVTEDEVRKEYEESKAALLRDFPDMVNKVAQVDEAVQSGLVPEIGLHPLAEGAR